MNPNGTVTSAEEMPVCFTCGKELPGGQWFARIRRGERRLVFCRPYCLEAFLQQEGSAAELPLDARAAAAV